MARRRDQRKFGEKVKEYLWGPIYLAKEAERMQADVALLRDFVVTNEIGAWDVLSHTWGAYSLCSSIEKWADSFPHFPTNAVEFAKGVQNKMDAEAISLVNREETVALGTAELCHFGLDVGDAEVLGAIIDVGLDFLGPIMAIYHTGGAIHETVKWAKVIEEQMEINLMRMHKAYSNLFDELAATRKALVLLVEKNS
jgi:hypothetical protein